MPLLQKACRAKLEEWDAQRQIALIVGFEVDELGAKCCSIAADVDEAEQTFEIVTEKTALVLLTEILDEI